MKAAALAAALLAGAASADAPGPGFDALHFDVAVTPNFKARSLSGSTTIRLRSLEAGLAALALSANALAIDSATLDGSPVRLAAAGDVLTVTFPRALAKGETATLAFAYHGTPRRGVVFDGDSVFTSYFACDWMICAQDLPGDRATLALWVTVPSGMRVIGVGEETGIAQDRRHRTETHRFESGMAFSAYLYAFAAGRFESWSTEAGGTVLSVFGDGIAPAQLAARFGTTPAMLAFFEEKSGVPFPRAAYPQLYVAADEAQEAATFSIVGEPAIGPILSDRTEHWAIAHELAHQWWGNLITCASWQEFWLNEGITTFMTAAWKEHAFGRAAYEREMDLARSRVAKARDKGIYVHLTFPGPYPSLGLKRAIVYAKGALFMDALRTELGDEIFWRAFKAYSRAHVGGSVTSRDFQAAFEAQAGRSLQALFDEWVY